ncbi:hypothetical protein [Actinophytocola oryzae]|uniref:PH (Pleckstrin Homology) domain-containing protein n=1 Tax=Actinophytocola oryzae TaxID=502181 RepID=A0A4R7V487_9PSEU|nr:hypothetical protein [Actinophytocola oryzae]TDV42735.1 hypothetical protein CLV71_117207 [Actinophytocola oryzae]
MKVRYNPAVGTVMIVLGAVCVFLGLWLAMLGEFNPGIVVGLVPMVLGILYFVRPYFLVSPGSVALVAVFGPVRREFPYETLEFTGGKVFAVRGDGTRKRVPVARWMANSGDWQRWAAVSAGPSPAGR